MQKCQTHTRRKQKESDHDDRRDLAKGIKVVRSHTVTRRIPTSTHFLHSLH
jgi:hypothetical protein